MEHYDQIRLLFSDEEKAQIIEAISSQYFSAYYIDLDSDSYREITASRHARPKFQAEGNSANGIEQFTRAIVVPEYYEQMRDFVDKQTMKVRLRERPFVFEEYKSRFGAWCRAIIIVIKRDEAGEASAVFFGTYTIDDFKQKSLENEKEIRDRNVMISALSSDYSSIFFADFSKDILLPLRISDSVSRKYPAFLAPNCSIRAVTAYIEETVQEEDREKMLRALNPDFLQSVLKEQAVWRMEFRSIWKELPAAHYFQMKLVRLSKETEDLRVAVGFVDIDAEKRDSLERYAYVDELTGGPNYNRFKESLRLITGAGYLVAMNIHSFRAVNSICGAETGDRVIRAIWRCIEEILPGAPLKAHIHADNFILYLPTDSPEELSAELTRLSEAIRLLAGRMRTPQLIAYFGVSRWVPYSLPENVCNEANTALKHSRETLTEPIAFFRKEDADRLLEIELMETSFEKALADGEFEVWYQPKYHAANGKIAGAEALCRWRRKDGTLVPPASFIPVFERDGLIRMLDEAVFRRVCARQSERLKNGQTIVPISINLSRSSLFYADLADVYRSIIRELGVGPIYMPLEITESAAVEGYILKGMARQLKAAGFPLHIDDFGTGYSSLSAISDMEYDTIKLDKKLIDPIGEYSGNRLLTHIIAYFKEMGIRVVAEGVEKEEQLRFLQSLGCDYIQGYYYSPPVSYEEFDRLLGK